jgi:formylglycine-generating enzyme required for sulfatase activity
MTWSEAVAFCDQVTKLLHQEKLLPEGEVIRLPTEQEWEYCCRAGTSTAYSFGDEAQTAGDASPKASLLDKYGWHTGNAAGNDPAVGVLAPNPWGLYDVHGYLWEFCQDGPEASELTCLVRGGSWKDPFLKLRSFSRKEFSKSLRDDAIGFRCVRAVR